MVVGGGIERHELGVGELRQSEQRTEDEDQHPEKRRDEQEDDARTGDRPPEVAVGVQPVVALVAESGQRLAAGHEAVLDLGLALSVTACCHLCMIRG